MAKPDHAVWSDILTHLRGHHADMCRQWFEELVPIGPAEGVFLVRAQQNVHQRYLQRECSERFTDALQAVTGRLMAVRFIGPDDQAPTPRPEPQQRAEPNDDQRNGAALNGYAPANDHRPAGHQAPTDRRPDSQGPNAQPQHTHGLESALGRVLPPHPEPKPSRFTPAPPAVTQHDGLVISPDHSFDQFVVGPENRLANAAARAVADKPGKAYNPLFIHGGVGLGKTHLLQAICLTILEHNPDAVIYYVSCEGFSTQFHEAVRQGQMQEFRHRFRHLDVLLIDDIHFLAGLDRTQEEFFHTFNSLYQQGKQIVLSSDAPPHEIPELEARLVSRFQSGLVVPVNPPSFETRVEIVKQKARLRGLDVPDDVAAFIAGARTANIRELEGAIVNVQMLHLTDNAPIDIDLVRAALNDREPDVKPEITIEDIIEVVVAYFGVKLTDLQSKRRQKSIAHPRQVCMHLAREHTRYSLEEIGGYFGGRDHTTVMHADRTVRKKRAEDADFDRKLAGLEQQLGLYAPSRPGS